MQAPSREELLNLLKTDVQKFNEFKKANPTLAIDFSGADLHNVNLRQAELGRINLSACDLRQADLTEAQLGSANLEGADLRGAIIRGINLHRANMRGVKLEGAKLGPFAEDSMRVCLHPSSFEGVEYDKRQLEDILEVLNLNKSWRIKYQLEPKS